MQLTRIEDFKKRKKTDVMMIPFWKGEKAALPAYALQNEMEAFTSLIELPLKSLDFKGTESETLMLYGAGPKESRLLLVGLGTQKTFTPETARRAYAAALKVCRKLKLKNLSVLVPKLEIPVVSAMVEGMLLANYSFDHLKSEPGLPEIESIALAGIDANAFAVCKRAMTVADAVNYARDLINGNADDVTPQALAAAAKELEKEFSTVKTTIFDKKRIEKEKMGLLLAVNRGSKSDPAFILVEYRGNPRSSDVTALVGKGITFDTGGLNLKPTGSIETMKDDMSGAAAVLGTLRAAAALRLKVNILGAIPATENGIGPNTYKPGDVYRGYSGKTVEIANTDAEGRLVLADALSYIQKNYKLSRIVDLATLTGAAVIALGEEASALFCNDDTFAEHLMEAGTRSAERLWRMPLYPEYKEQMKSKIADLKNSGGRPAGVCTAAAFLHHFITETPKEIPWAHLDIAGTAYLTTPKHYHPTHATGVGVRMLIEFFLAHETQL